MPGRVELVSVTPNAEQHIVYCARVSSPENQLTGTTSRLLNYCVENKHWSVFEMANMVVEITTSRAMSSQIIRHPSFSYQEFSQRYSKAASVITYLPRRQDPKNRQSSIDDLDGDTKVWFTEAQRKVADTSLQLYELALRKGIAKECARFLLPMNTTTRLYMNGTIRSWIHYIQLRTGNGTQKEHMDIANDIKAIFVENLPATAKSLGWA